MVTPNTRHETNQDNSRFTEVSAKKSVQLHLSTKYLQMFEIMYHQAVLQQIVVQHRYSRKDTFEIGVGDREELKKDWKQMGNIVTHKAGVWNDFGRAEKGEYERKAQAYNVMEDKVAPFPVETRNNWLTLLSNCLVQNLHMLRE
ncbi:hypothetical protein BDC45DRAFT_534825 [Circinella umbellata]|nr:hypothetical protein BDC45DRAFT_534825 [Circinella umbellata]